MEWQPLFAHHQYTSIVLNSLQWHCEQERILLFAFVVMPTHLHWIGKPYSPSRQRGENAPPLAKHP